MNARDMNHMNETAAEERADERRNAESEALDKMTADGFNKVRDAIQAGDKRQTIYACNSLLEFLANSSALPELLRTALNGDGAETGRCFTKILSDVLMSDAEADAEQELARQLRERAPRLSLGPVSKAQMVALQSERMQV